MIQIYDEHDLVNYSVQPVAKFEVAGFLSDDQSGGIKIEFEFDQSSFDSCTIKCVAQTFRHLVESLAQCQTP